MYEFVSLLLGKATESEARVYLRACGDSTITKIEGRLHGPICDFSHTLPSEYAVHWAAEDQNAKALLLDPCYWAPSLPFQYELDLTLTCQSGTSRHEKRLVGFRRWAAEGVSVFLERRRTVVRGCRSESLSPEALQEARGAETALLVGPPADDYCEAASRIGISLLVDLRETTEPIENLVRRLSWHPAVMMVLISREQLDHLDELKTPFLTAVTVSPDSAKPEAAHSGCDLFAVELAPSETPPAWLADSTKPVIAIRCEAAYAGFQAGRATCDRLQASLAPKFNFAGYFVSP